jgi:Tfp pilus assembly protein PilZ
VKASDRYFVDGVSCTLNGKTMRVANLSVGGLFAATDEPPIEGQVVVFALKLRERAPFEVVGKVTWINRPADSPKSPELPEGFGIKITKIAFPDKLAILDLLKRVPPSATRIRPTD